jgi:hypothetical protein
MSGMLIADDEWGVLQVEQAMHRYRIADQAGFHAQQRRDVRTGRTK